MVYRDETKIEPIDYDVNLVPEAIRKNSNYVREKMYGEDVREAVARSAEIAGLIASDAKVASESIWEDWQEVNSEWDSDPNKDPEIILGRGGHDSLSERFDQSDNKIDKTNKILKTTKSPSYYNGPLFAILDDDGRNSFKDNMVPILNAKGLKATIGVITSRVGTSNYMTLADLKLMQEQGHEIVSHSNVHERYYNNDDESEETVEADVRTAKEYLVDNGLTSGSDIFVYPFSGGTDRAKRIVGKYHDYAINSVGGVIADFPFDNLRVPRFEIAMNLNFQTDIKPVIDECIAKNGLLIFLTHSNNNVDWDMFQTVLDYISSYEVVTVGEALRMKGNALSVGLFNQRNSLFVSQSGQIKGIPTKQGPNITATDLIENYVFGDYSENVLTIQNMHTQAVSNSNIGIPEGGLLLTWSSTRWYFKRIAILENRMFIQTWNGSTNVWNPWVETITNQTTGITFETSRITTGSTLNLNSHISNYPLKKVSITRVGSNLGVAGKNGVLETTRFEDYYAYQKFIATDGDVYHRYWDTAGTSGSPTAWKKATSTIVS